MTTIIRLADNEGHKRPEKARVYQVSNEADERKALEHYTSRYHRVPERVFVWRGMMYVEVER